MLLHCLYYVGTNYCFRVMAVGFSGCPHSSCRSSVSFLPDPGLVSFLWWVTLFSSSRTTIFEGSCPLSHPSWSLTEWRVGGCVWVSLRLKRWGQSSPSLCCPQQAFPTEVFLQIDATRGFPRGRDQLSQVPPRCFIKAGMPESLKEPVRPQQT